MCAAVQRAGFPLGGGRVRSGPCCSRCKVPAVWLSHGLAFLRTPSESKSAGFSPGRRPRFSPWVGKIPWRRKRQPTPVFLPGKSHGQRSLASEAAGDFHRAAQQGRGRAEAPGQLDGQLLTLRVFATPWTVAYQAPPSMGFSRQQYWSGLPFPSPGDLPDPGIEPGSPTL